jgi:predicted porin
MVLSSSFAFAADDVKVEAGIKMWNNEWESKDPIDGTIKFDAALLIGPAVSVTLPSNLFFEASYLFSVTDYEKTEGTAKIEVERDDLDLAVGYMFIPEFGIFAGYRSTSMDWKFTDVGGGESGSFDVSGPVIGLRANYSFNDMFGVYASAAYLMTESEWKDATGTFTEDAPGTQFELGVKATFSKQLSGTLGYKVESFEGDKSKTEDTFSGVTLGVMYAF